MYAKHQMGGDDQTVKHDLLAGHKKTGGHQAYRAHMVADFRRRFWVSLVITIPVLLLSPLIQNLPGVAGFMTLAAPKSAHAIGQRH